MSKVKLRLKDLIEQLETIHKNGDSLRNMAIEGLTEDLREILKTLENE